MLDFTSLVEEALFSRASDVKQEFFIDVGYSNLVKVSFATEGYVLTLVNEDKNLSALIRCVYNERELNYLLKGLFGVELADDIAHTLGLISRGLNGMRLGTRVVSRRALTTTIKEDYIKAWERVA